MKCVNIIIGSDEIYNPYSCNGLIYLKHALSYDVTVIHWITSCHKKCYVGRFHNTFGGNKKSDDKVC